MAGADLDWVGEEDFAGEEGDASLGGVEGAEVFGGLPCPEHGEGLLLVESGGGGWRDAGARGVGYAPGDGGGEQCDGDEGDSLGGAKGHVRAV